MHAIRFNSNESLDKLDKELLNEPNIIKDNPIEVKKIQDKTKEMNLEEDFIASNDDSINGLSASIQPQMWASMIRSKVKELDSFVVDVEKLITRCLQEIQTDDVILNPIEEWMSRFTKYNEISKNKHKTDKEGAENKLQEVHSQDAVNQEGGEIPQMVEPISQISPTILCDLIVKDLDQQNNIKKDDDKKGDGNLELVHQSQEISSTLMNDMIDAVNKVEIEIESKKAELKEDKIAIVHLQAHDKDKENTTSQETDQLSQEISHSLLCEMIDAVVKAEVEICANLEGKVEGHDDEIDKQKSIQSTKKGKEEEEHNEDVAEMKDKYKDEIENYDDVDVPNGMEEHQRERDQNENVLEVQGHKDKNEEDKKEDIVQVQEMTEISPTFVGELIQAVEKVELEHNKDVKELNELSLSLVDDMIEAVDKVEEKPKNPVDRQKRIIKVSDALRSPYRQRIVQLNVERVKIEERISEWIFSATGQVWEILFDTSINNKFAKISFESFYPKQYIHIGVMSCWSNVLNHEEQFKSKDSTSRLFCPCNMLGENNFKARMRLNELLINLETNIESTILSSIYKSVEDVDILVVPILQDSHYYLVCFNFKNETIDVIDNMKGKMKPKQKYRVTRMLLLSDVNLLHDKVMSQLEEFEKIDISEREKLKKGAEKRIIQRIKKYC
ncbi:hypothetical protein E3N88_41112 [Mikania micrantha]|uniref:Ubiquitin-like protease family profile domain-containing protein n=1 Tax=Mikania micrantha TaxID=192012 RepID=A0A5N6LPM3_9ASTR|nr:hypothetical protein E3N88_41112 [Mikania micrantha]